MKIIKSKSLNNDLMIFLILNKFIIKFVKLKESVKFFKVYINLRLD